MYAYYGGIYIGRDTAVDTNGNLIGYGYSGSSNSQNRDHPRAYVRLQRDHLERRQSMASCRSLASIRI